jgi:hypothetical protein
LARLARVSLPERLASPRAQRWQARGPPPELRAPTSQQRDALRVWLREREPEPLLPVLLPEREPQAWAARLQVLPPAASWQLSRPRPWRLYLL